VKRLSDQVEKKYRIMWKKIGAAKLIGVIQNMQPPISCRCYR